MSKFNRGPATPKRVRTKSPIKSTLDAGATTYEGGAAYSRDAKSELFLLGVANFVSEDTFYEGGDKRDARFDALCAHVAVTDGPWFRDFIFWLRRTANMRHASLVGAVEGVRARLAAGVGQPTLSPVALTRRPDQVRDGLAGWVVPGESDGVSNRQIISSVLQRADEPGEMMAYCRSIWERTIPKPIKRGIADATNQIYTERSLLKYDTDKAAFRFGDVIEMTHPDPRAAWVSDLFKHAIDRRHDRGEEIPESLEMLRARRELMAMPVEERREMIRSGQAIIPLHNAGMTWESVAGWIQGPMDKPVWEAIIPSMGYMALLRNLRNFMDAGVSDEVMNGVLARLADPEEVAKSRQFPFRFLSAYKEMQGNLKVSAVLEQALTHSVVNVPKLPGKTLILSDMSGSMSLPAGGKMSNLKRSEPAAIFAAALALRAENATLVAFGTNSFPINFRPGDSVLTVAQMITGRNLGGTNTAETVKIHFNNHDRVIIVTDEQASRTYGGQDPSSAVPANVPMYTWNLAGYQHGHAPSGEKGRHTFGGLTDQSFKLIPMLEAGTDGVWPWQMEDTEVPELTK